LACGLPASRYEAVAARFLTEKGYQVFLPTCKSRRQRSDRSVPLELPLFPGYLFCRCAEPHISSVLNTCGVLRVLGTRESPAVVNEEEIRHLATVTRAKLDLQPCAFITSGQKVRIHRGPLCGVEGIITGFDSRKHHYPETFHGFDTVAASEVARRARREHYKVLCHALQSRPSGSTGYDPAANHGTSQVVNGR
jgi:transcription antitermination factor NusG